MSNSSFYSNTGITSADVSSITSAKEAAATSETNAATSATEAATSATQAATSATNAASSETNVSNSAATATTSAANASTSETNASASAATATTQASNAATSATAAAGSASTAGTSATNAASSATNAATSETNAATSETNAANSATSAATSATNAGTSETNAAASASSASGYVTSATTQANNAATSATAAATSETNAAASATAASTSASGASTSASNANTSATNAASSASQAASSAAAAALAADNFDDTYLGSNASDPTTDNDGDALNAGDLHFNTSSNTLKVYNGSAWQDAAIDSSGFVQTTGDTMTGALDVQSTITADGLTVDGTATLQNILNIGGSDPQIRTDTSDGSDNKTLWMGGGGIAYSWDRGGFFYAQGNEAGGHVGITAGNVSGGSVKFTTGGSEAMRIGSAGNVGLGTTSTAGHSNHTNLFLGGTGNIYAEKAATADASLHISQNAHVDTDGSWEYRVTDEATNYYQYAGHHVWRYAASGTAGNDISWSEAMRITSSGSVGIGTSSPSSLLTIHGSQPIITLSDPDSGSTSTISGNSGHLVLNADSGGNYPNTVMDFQIDNSQKMRLDSDGLTINNSGQSQSLLSVGGGSTNAALRLRGSTGSAYAWQISSNAYLASALEFTKSTAAGGTTFSTPSMILDNSGNLLVGTTNGAPVSNNVVGISARGQYGELQVSTEGSTGAPLYLNRKTSDGDIAVFRKDGTTVGIIASNGGAITIGSGDVGVYYDAGSDRILPMNASTNSVRNDAIDIGGNPHRFKDLYLSGGVYLGGTGAANKLDDYEEGTFNATLLNVSATLNGSACKYTKIGNIVHIFGNIDVTTLDTADGSSLTLGNLPFSASTNGFSHGTFVRGYNKDELFPSSVATDITGIHVTNSNSLNFNRGTGTGVNPFVTYDLLNTSGEFSFGVTYTTNS